MSIKLEKETQDRSTEDVEPYTEKTLAILRDCTTLFSPSMRCIASPRSELEILLTGWFEDGKESSRKLWLEVQSHEDLLQAILKTQSLLRSIDGKKEKYIISGDLHSLPHPHTHTPDEADFQNIVRALVFQIVKIVPETDTLDIDDAALRELEHGLRGFSSSLKVLETVIRQAPNVRYCILYGLNHYEAANALVYVKYARLLLKLVTLTREDDAHTFSVLFITHGPSKILAQDFMATAGLKHCQVGVGGEV